MSGTDCFACRLITGEEPLPGGAVLRTGHWVVEHCVGPLGVGTFVTLSNRDEVSVIDFRTHTEVARVPVGRPLPAARAPRQYRRVGARRAELIRCPAR
ncbi:hypothetical protein [Actinacidiphila oryziradicis]|uniref:Uncharacterized protein n=1 Tax=Actinacidiphila oryziradicis TaxID=2571141 RepID=A0A4U0SIS0_9ACTN|nr:hypothetical protein [Actinacidiphila oryziradicis]TKA09630.1 hypothetical protein FCI23_21140 [Actinacidiphila oryziradicis]